MLSTKCILWIGALILCTELLLLFIRLGLAVWTVVLAGVLGLWTSDELTLVTQRAFNSSFIEGTTDRAFYFCTWALIRADLFLYDNWLSHIRIDQREHESDFSLWLWLQNSGEVGPDLSPYVVGWVVRDVIASRGISFANFLILDVHLFSLVMLALLHIVTVMLIVFTPWVFLGR